MGQEWFLFPMRMFPRVDGDFFPDDPEVLLREGKYADVDVISGTTADEGAFFINGRWCCLSLASILQERA